MNFAALLTLLFIGLKLLHKISWPWFWVVSPIFIELLIEITVTAVCTILKIWGGGKDDT